jgi:hypothetical protein
MSDTGRTLSIGIVTGLALALGVGALYLWGTRGAAILLDLYNMICG